MLAKPVSLRRWKCVVQLVLLMAFCVMSTGCAAVMAARQPDKKDLSVLQLGTNRNMVMTELGVPQQTSKSADGVTTDSYNFKQGYSGGTKCLRVAGHVVGDSMTFFLWEFAGMPLEMAHSGEEVRAEVAYDSGDRAQRIEFYRGAYLYRGGATAPAWMKRDAQQTALIGDPNFGRESAVQQAAAFVRVPAN